MKPSSTPNYQPLYLLIGAAFLLLIGIWLGRVLPSWPGGNVSSEPPVIEPDPRFFPDGSELPPAQACTMDARICPDGSAVGRTGPNCEFAPCPGEETSDACPVKNLRILSPLTDQAVTFPLSVRGVVDNSAQPDCAWVVFEGQAGTLTLYDATNQVVGQSFLQAQGDWMTTGPVVVTGTVELSQEVSAGQPLRLVINDDDPSGLRSPQMIEIPLRY